MPFRALRTEKVSFSENALDKEIPPILAKRSKKYAKIHHKTLNCGF